MKKIVKPQNYCAASHAVNGSTVSMPGDILVRGGVHVAIISDIVPANEDGGVSAYNEVKIIHATQGRKAQGVMP
jgi:hypothetical protein